MYVQVLGDGICKNFCTLLYLRLIDRQDALRNLTIAMEAASQEISNELGRRFGLIAEIYPLLRLLPRI